MQDHIKELAHVYGWHKHGFHPDQRLFNFVNDEGVVLSVYWNKKSTMKFFNLTLMMNGKKLKGVTNSIYEIILERQYIFANQNTMDTFKDTDIMPFGKHKGEKMANVPSSYLRWLSEQFEEKGHLNATERKLRNYIDQNIDDISAKKK